MRGKSSPWLSADIKTWIHGIYFFVDPVKTRPIFYWRNASANGIKMIFRTESDFTRTFLSENVSNLDAFWSTIERICPSKSKPSQMEK